MEPVNTVAEVATEESIAEVCGLVSPSGVREFLAAPARELDRMLDFARGLASMDDDRLHRAAVRAIHDSALVNSFRGNWNADHFRASAVYAEAKRRGGVEHEAGCRAIDNRYQSAYNEVARSQGHSSLVAKLSDCSCGR